jgi:hypothetical protein
VEQADRGELVLRRRLAIPDLQVELQIYDRTSAPGREAPCQ